LCLNQTKITIKCATLTRNLYLIHPGSVFISKMITSLSSIFKLLNVKILKRQVSHQSGSNFINNSFQHEKLTKKFEVGSFWINTEKHQFQIFFSKTSQYKLKYIIKCQYTSMKFTSLWNRKHINQEINAFVYLSSVSLRFLVCLQAVWQWFTGIWSIWVLCCVKNRWEQLIF